MPISLLDAVSKIFKPGESSSAPAPTDPRGTDATRADRASEIGQTTAGFGTGNKGPGGLKALYQYYINGKPIASEEELRDNPLNKYINVSYGISLSLVDAKAGSDNTFASLMKAKKICFASTGGTETDIDYFYGISSLNAKSLLSVSASNPELAYTIEMNMELHEPIGFSLDYNIRKSGKELGLDPQPLRFIWRVDVWFSGYDPNNGSWVKNIQYEDFTKAGKPSKITYFVHMMACDTNIGKDGTTYNLHLAPVNLGSAIREEVILSPGVEWKVPRDQAKIGKCMELVAGKLTTWSKEKGNNFTYVIVVPPEIEELELFQPGLDGKYDSNSTSDIIKIPFTNPTTAISIIHNILKLSPTLIGAGQTEDDKVPNLTFTVIPEIDYSTAKYAQNSGPNNKGYNDYTNVTIRYTINPYFEWKSKLPGSDLSTRESYAYKFLRRIYDYAWTGTNTEVLGFEAKLKTTYYINEGFSGLQSQTYAGAPGSSEGSSTPQTRQQDYNENRQGFKDRKSEPWKGSPGPSKGSAAGGEGGRGYAPGNSPSPPPGTNRPYGSPLGNAPMRTPSDQGDFGPRVDPITGAPGYHAGHDYGASPGTPIYSTQPGVVQCTDAAYGGKGGNQVRIEGGRYDTRYLHMKSFADKCGKTVRAGEVIGYVGSTGRSTGPHLHYEVYDNDKLDDPEKYAPRAPVYGPGFSPKGGSGDGLGGDEENSGSNSSQQIAYGRAQPVYSPVPVNRNFFSQTDKAREAYELSLERRIGPDLIKLDNFQVRGDPRWFVGRDQYGKYANQLSSLIRINILVPDQHDYMNPNSTYEKAETSIGGFYELISIDHEFRGGSFIQKMNGYRVIGLNLT
jgi:murein DD-endopeptidase MepM/ murein hydrolase activator NlpD